MRHIENQKCANVENITTLVRELNELREKNKLNELNKLKGENEYLEVASELVIIKIRLYVDKIKKLKTENEKYKKIIRDVQNTVIFQKELFFVLNPFGEENINFLTQTNYMKIFMRGTMSVIALIKKIHFNKNIPENHNVYVFCMRDDYGILFNGDHWIIQDINILLDEMYKNSAQHLLEHFEQMRDIIDEQTTKIFEKFVQTHETDDKLKMNIKKKLHKLLYDERKMLEHYHEIKSYSSHTDS
jgi:hypothetical protein